MGGKLKHSPGPWYPMEFAGFWTLADSDHYDSDDLFDSNSVGEDKAEANAKLASHAPEMINALQEILKLWNDPKNPSGAWDHVIHGKVTDLINKIEND